MPLNPPSYIGHDVWYSPDVYVNQVPVALWQPPQVRGIPEKVLAGLQASALTEGLIWDGNSTQTSLQMAAVTQNLLRKGIITQEDINNGKIPPSETSAATGKQNPSISNDTGGIENRGDFLPTLQLSRHYKLGDLTGPPGTTLGDQGWTRKQMWKNGNGGIPPGKLVANLKLLAVNILDPILDKYPDMRVSNSIRAAEGADDISRGQKKQHPRGMAADIQLNNWNKHYELAKWIEANLNFDQLLIERNYKGTWVHVSYADPPMVDKGSKVGWINTYTGDQKFGQLANI